MYAQRRRGESHHARDARANSNTTRLLQDLGPNNCVKEWTRETLQESSATSISRAEVLKGIKEEQERKRAQPLDTAEMPTMYLPAIPKSPPLETNELAVQILTIPIEEPEEEDPCVQISASAEYHTLDLIHQAVEELGSMPTLIVVSNLRHMASEKLLRRIRYHCHGVRIPIVPSDGPCNFDVKVWGSKL